MCLTIPAQIIKLEKGKAVVRENDRFKQVQISLVPNLKVGDWILYINDLALKKIPKNEAKEILELLETPYQKIDISGEDYFYTDDMLKEIIKKIKRKCRVFIFVSIGERGYKCYERLKKKVILSLVYAFLLKPFFCHSAIDTSRRRINNYFFS
jgi:hydrogenase assembly chaperone HypC/HupF